MKNVYENRVVFDNAERACEVMDWLNDNGVKHNITLENRKYAFCIMASRLQIAMVKRYFEEV